MTPRGIKAIVRATGDELAAMPHAADGSNGFLAIEDALNLMADAIATPSTRPCPYCGGSRFRCCEYAADRVSGPPKETEAPGA